MGNVVTGLNNDGENSQLFLGNYHNVGSSISNFTGDDVKFSGTGQNIEFNGSNQSVRFDSGVKVTYNTKPVFEKGIDFSDSNNINIGGTQLFKDGLINPTLIPSDLPIKTVTDLTSNGTLNSNNLVTSGYSQVKNNFYVGTGGENGYEGAPFKITNNGDLTTSGKLNANSVTAINLNGNLTGDVVGNVTGNLKGNVTGDVVGNVTGNIISNGDISASSITGKVIYGPLTGDVTGNLKGNVEGNLKGNVQGDVVGNLKGNVEGNVNGNLKGNVDGNLTGNVEGNLKGNVEGTLKGTVEGTLKGNVEGNLKGNVEGNLKGNVEGDNVSAKTIFADNGLTTSSSGSVNGPSGGLKINGQNNWIIGENSKGQLCFYNTKSGLENSSTTPFVCLSATGYLVRGNA